MSAIGLLVFVLGSHALGQRRHPSAAIAWVLMITLLPELGVPLYLMFGTRKLPRAARRSPGAARVGAPGAADAADAAPAAGPPRLAASPVASPSASDPVDGPGGAHGDRVPLWTRRLTAAMGLHPAQACHDLSIHADGRAAREALLRVVDAARERLDVCTFILGRDEFGAEFLERIAARARAGVRVRLLVDGMGAWMGGRREFSRASQAGVQVLRFAPPFRMPWRGPLRGRTNLRNHRKLVVADSRLLWTGGRNLAGEYFEGAPGRPAWTDLSFDLAGPLAAEATAVFEADWAFAQSSQPEAIEAAFARGREAAEAEAAVGAPSAGMASAQLLPSGPDYAEDTVHALLLTSCYRARTRILAVTPYLVPDESLLAALCLAARRGVRVDIVMPARSNHRLADIARHRPMRELAAAGAQLWLAPGMVHAKAVVIDEHLAMAGSVNLDGRSLFLNYELMVGFYRPQDIAGFARWIEALVADARAYQARPAGLARFIAEGLVLWLAFQL
ncbi:MAG: PLDc N-terminal domain-containing protein [Betaproteobacteria bacterium]|nr:PLDc N-terminal domain-containing protein [Betaproteobacteria bacterium]